MGVLDCQVAGTKWVDVRAHMLEVAGMACKSKAEHEQKWDSNVKHVSATLCSKPAQCPPQQQPSGPAPTSDAQQPAPGPAQQAKQPQPQPQPSLRDLLRAPAVEGDDDDEEDEDAPVDSTIAYMDIRSQVVTDAHCDSGWAQLLPPVPTADDADAFQKSGEVVPLLHPIRTKSTGSLERMTSAQLEVLMSWMQFKVVQYGLKVGIGGGGAAWH